MQAKKKALLTIFLVVFIDLIGFGMMIPILPYYAKSFGASATLLGFLMMSYSGMQFLFSPFWGRFSDRMGRRPVLLTCIAGIASSMLLLGFARSLFWLFAGRLLAGFFGANISTAQAYIADVTPPEERTKGMGMIGAAFGLGFLFGPALGGVLSKWGYGTVAFAVAALALANWLFAVFFLKEPELPENLRREHRARFTWKQWRMTLAEESTGIPILLFFLVTFGMAQMETSFAYFILARFGLGAMNAGLILAGMALMMAIIQGGAIGRLAKQAGEMRLVLVGTLIMIPGLVSASFVPYLKPFVLSMLVYVIGYSIVSPSLSSLVSKGAGKSVQGLTMGIYQSAGSLARMLGPILAGFLYDNLGMSAPFLSASFFFVAVLFILLRGSIKKVSSK